MSPSRFARRGIYATAGEGAVRRTWQRCDRISWCAHVQSRPKASNNNFRYAVREPADWCAGPARSPVMHRPTQAIFVLFPRKRLPRDAFLKLEDFDAFLMCVCDGRTGPWGFEFEQLRREAVVMGWSCLGYVRPIRIFGLRARRRAFGHGYLWLKPSACDALCTAAQQPQTDRYFHSETVGRQGWEEAVPDFDRDALKRSIQALRSGNPTRHRSVTRANLQPELSAIDSHSAKSLSKRWKARSPRPELTSAGSARRSPAIRRKRLIASPSSDREPRLQSIRSPARPPGRAVASSRCARWPDVRFRRVSRTDRCGIPQGGCLE
jgi:hypothetical protein